MKWGTTSTSAQLIGNFAGALEDIDRRLSLGASLSGKTVAEGSGTLAMLPQEQTLPVLSLEQ
jgi:hypothetical protein